MERDAIEAHGARIRAGEEEQVVHERGEVLHLGIDVPEGVADLTDRARGVAAKMLDRAPDDRERGAQLVARVGRELALVPERGALRGKRVADGHQRPARVDGAKAHRHEHDHETAADEHEHEALQRPDLGGAVLDDLHGELGLRRVERHRELADRHVRRPPGRTREPDGDRGQPDIPSRPPGVRGGGEVGQALRDLEPARTDRSAVGRDQDGERAAASEDEVDRRFRAPRRPPERANVVDTLLEGADPGRLER
jgi:hypothetical protein